jgi:hypothetical protein
MLVQVRNNLTQVRSKSNYWKTKRFWNNLTRVRNNLTQVRGSKSNYCLSAIIS